MESMTNIIDSPRLNTGTNYSTIDVSKINKRQNTVLYIRKRPFANCGKILDIVVGNKVY